MNDSVMDEESGREPAFDVRDIVVPWPASSGFYVVSGGADVLPVLVDAVVRFNHAESLSAVPSTVGPVYWVDSGNTFNTYHTAALARWRRIESLAALRAIKVARPFTAFQLQQMLSRIPGPLRLEGTSLAADRTEKIPLVIVSDLMALFLDPEMPDDDMKRAFREFLIKLLHVKGRAVVIGVHRERAVTPTQGEWTRRVLEMADHVYRPADQRSPALGFQERRRAYVTVPYRGPERRTPSERPAA